MILLTFFTVLVISPSANPLSLEDDIPILMRYYIEKAESELPGESYSLVAKSTAPFACDSPRKSCTLVRLNTPYPTECSGPPHLLGPWGSSVGIGNRGLLVPWSKPADPVLHHISVASPQLPTESVVERAGISCASRRWPPGSGPPFQ